MNLRCPVYNGDMPALSLTLRNVLTLALELGPNINPKTELKWQRRNA